MIAFCFFEADGRKVGPTGRNDRPQQHAPQVNPDLNPGNSIEAVVGMGVVVTSRRRRLF